MELFPLLRWPPSWSVPVVAVTAMLGLAFLDLVGAYAAKEWSMSRSPAMAGLGVAAFLTLFWLYASSLRYAELSVVTLGWVVVLQLGIVALEWWRYGVALPTGKLLAMVVILVATAYLLVPANLSTSSVQ